MSFSRQNILQIVYIAKVASFIIIFGEEILPFVRCVVWSFDKEVSPVVPVMHFYQRQCDFRD